MVKETHSHAADLAAGRVVVYTDGACSRNPGPGGYGVVLLYQAARKELSAGYRLTTNNRMELMACIAGLRSLKTRCQVTVYSDSRYVVDGMTLGWARRWRAKGWMRTATERALNADLWGELLALSEQHEVKFLWVRGHAGTLENERCDQLSTTATAGPDWVIDRVFEAGPT